MEQHGRYPIGSPEPTVSPFALIRALAIAGIIVENWHNALSWNDAGTLADALVKLASTAAGTFVHLFFILSGFGLMLSRIKTATPSWAAWASERFGKIVAPYWAAVVFAFAVANLSPLWAPPGWQASFSWVTLGAYLSFLRNIYEPGWGLNPSFWFMPVIIGLYALFPLLLQGLKRMGEAAFLAVSVLATWGFVAAALEGGYSVGHQAASPLYFVGEFALGMALACVAWRQPERFQRLLGWRYFPLGAALYAAGAAMAEYGLLGEGSTAYNDLFSASGLFLVLLPVCRWLCEHGPAALLGLCDGMSRRSYAMYLAHWPVLGWVVKPLFGNRFSAEMSALPMFGLSLVFVTLMYALAEGLACLVPAKPSAG